MRDEVFFPFFPTAVSSSFEVHLIITKPKTPFLPGQKTSWEVFAGFLTGANSRRDFFRGSYLHQYFELGRSESGLDTTFDKSTYKYEETLLFGICDAFGKLFLAKTWQRLRICQVPAKSKFSKTSQTPNYNVSSCLYVDLSNAVCKPLSDRPNSKY